MIICIFCVPFGRVKSAFDNGCYLKKDESYMVDLLQKQELSGAFERMRLREQIKKCKEEGGAEFVIVLLHIGGQFNAMPSGYTVEVCEYCKENGADLMIANHEHVIHPFKNDSTFCWYSLGNFLSSDGVWNEPFDNLCQYSAVVHADLGIPTAMTYSLYKPLAEKDSVKIAAMVSFFRKVYLVIAGAVLVTGLCLIPVIPYVVKPDSPVPNLVFFLFYWRDPPMRDLIKRILSR